jgi:hypothetical protein
MSNPALAELHVLLGTWRVELANAAWLDAGRTLVGECRVEWLDDFFLVVRSRFEGDPAPPLSTSVVGRNEDRDDYTVLYADERGVSRVYAMTYADGLWVQHREDPGFHQRFEGRVAPDGSRIDAAWSAAYDEVTWEHDFDLTYTRVDGP